MRINNISSTYQATKNQKNQTPSFKGVPNFISDGLSQLYGKVASNDTFVKGVSKFSKFQKVKPFTCLMIAESVILSGFYMITTLRNKKIKKEQKPQMLVNDTLTLGVSATGALVLDGVVTKAVDKMSESYFLKNQDFYINEARKAAENAQKSGILKSIGEAAENVTEDGIKAITDKIGEQAKDLIAKGQDLKAFQITSEKLGEIQEGVTNAIKSNSGNAEAATKAATEVIGELYDKLAGKVEADKIVPGINKLKTIVIFGIIYRYLSPVVMTPIANKISAKFFDKKNKTEKA